MTPPVLFMYNIKRSSNIYQGFRSLILHINYIPKPLSSEAKTIYMSCTNYSTPKNHKSQINIPYF